MKPYRYFADVSNNNAVPALSEYAKAGHVLLALKASEGLSFVDGTHAPRSRTAHGLGLAVLHYHFARPDLGHHAVDEADFFTRTVKPEWAPGDYVCLDMERGVQKRLGTETRWSEEFCQRVKRNLGATPVVYANESTMNTLLMNLWRAIKRKWVAKYGTGIPSLIGGGFEWAWQFTDGVEGKLPHSLPGIGQGDISLLNQRTAIYLRLRTWRRRRKAHK